MFNALYQSDSVYVFRFRKELKGFAKFLRLHDYTLARASFIRERARAEIRTLLSFGEVVATIQVEGSEGAPWKMTIVSPQPIPVSAQQYLEKVLPALHVGFKVQT